MKLQTIISGLVIGGIGYALKYFSVVENPYIYYGVMGLGALLVIAGLFMSKY